MTADYPDEAPLVIPAPVCRVAAQLQRFTDSLRLGVLLIPEVALGPLRFHVRTVLDLDLRGPTSDHAEGLALKGYMALLPNHVFGQWPFGILAHPVLLPLLPSHCRRTFDHCTVTFPSVQKPRRYDLLLSFPSVLHDLAHCNTQKWS